MKSRINNVIRIPASLDKDFFKYWFLFLKPFHNLTDREMDVIACFVKQRFELSKVIKDDVILDKIVMSEDTKQKVREECEVSLPHFQVVMGKLRKAKVIVDGKINPKYIPRLEEDGDSFKLLLLFDLQ